MVSGEVGSTLASNNHEEYYRDRKRRIENKTERIANQLAHAY